MTVRVVIAEDEAIVRLDLKEILEEEGYEVVGETGRGDENTAVQLDSRGCVTATHVRCPPPKIARVPRWRR